MRIHVSLRPVRALRPVLALRLVRAIATALGLGALMAASPAMATPPATCDAATVVARVLPAIVNIWVAKILPETDSNGKPTDKQQVETFVGTGFVVDPSGIIVTNKHVIQNAAMIRVTFHNRSQVTARLLAASSLIDFAMLKVNLGKPLPTLQFANSDDVEVGQPVIAVGNPLGLGTSVSAGVISAVDRNLMKSPIDDFIQTDASINPGNSGGPLLDCNGDVVGVNSDLLSNSTVLGSIGIGFALPSNDVAIATTKLMHPEHVSPDWVGFELQDLTPALAQSFGVALDGGAIVTRVDRDSPAAQASLGPGDIITGVDGQTRYDARSIQRQVVITPPGTPITLSVWRGGQTRQVTLKGVDWPHMMAERGDVLASAASIERAEAEGTGLHLIDITPAARKHFDISDTSGVLIDHVTDGSVGYSLGLRPGDVIKLVADTPATTVHQVNESFLHADAKTGYLVPLLVHNKSNTWWVTMFVGHVTTADLLVNSPGAMPAGPSAVNAEAPHK